MMSYISVNSIISRPEFTGRHDLRAKISGRQCATTGSRAVQETEANIKRKIKFM